LEIEVEPSPENIPLDGCLSLNLLMIDSLIICKADAVCYDPATDLKEEPL